MRRPWLDNPAWTSRTIVCGPAVRGPFVLLAAIAIVAPYTLFLVIALDRLVLEEVGLASTIALVAIVAGTWAILGGLIYWWRRYQRYGSSHCRLLTLPGVVGGWFKADVECVLPPDAGEPVVIRLRNSVRLGRAAAEAWRMEEHHFVPITAGKRTIVPVRLRIPRHPDQVVWDRDQTRWEQFWTKREIVWRLEIEKKAGGVNFFAAFHVPVYDTPDAPESEQRPD